MRLVCAYALGGLPGTFPRDGMQQQNTLLRRVRETEADHLHGGNNFLVDHGATQKRVLRSHQSNRYYIATWSKGARTYQNVGLLGPV